MSDTTLGTPEQLKDTEYRPPLAKAVPLGIQHVLAMFASNVTPAIIVSLAAGFAFGSADMVYLIQMAMVFAGVATLFQTVGVGPVGARLPVRINRTDPSRVVIDVAALGLSDPPQP